MPGFLTHCLAANRLKKSLNESSRKAIEKHEKLYNLGAQGPDIFFYYFTGLGYKDVRGLGNLMHDGGLGLFILDMARQCRESKSDEAFAYTCGFVMHYCLDSTAHPYVYARTHTEGASSVKNSADHREFETAIDICMLLRLDGKKPGDLAHYSLIDAPKPDLLAAASVCGKAISAVYGRRISQGMTYAAMKSMVSFTWYLQSKKGRRKKTMRALEKISIREPLYSSMMHSQVADEAVLNLEKKDWLAPWPEAETENQSFVELFDKSVIEAAALCGLFWDFAHGGKDEGEFAEALGNKSLKTGI